MAFERGPLGQKNRALFYDVDVVVYVEGGREVGSKIESFDSNFWRVVFSVFRPDLKVRIVAKGSKTTLTQIASDVAQGLLENVIVAMDRDYDFLLSRHMEHNKIIYTYGYSYENDVYCNECLHHLFHNLCPSCPYEVDLSDQIVALTQVFARDVWWAHVADICGVQCGQQVIDRSSPGKYLMHQSYGGRPRVNRTALFTDVRRANRARRDTRVRRPGLRQDMLPRMSIGHLYAAFCFRVLAYLQCLTSKTQKLTRDGVTAAAIMAFESWIRNERHSDIYQHYKHSLAKC